MVFLSLVWLPVSSFYKVSCALVQQKLNTLGRCENSLSDLRKKKKKDFSSALKKQVALTAWCESGL